MIIPGHSSFIHSYTIRRLLQEIRLHSENDSFTACPTDPLKRFNASLFSAMVVGFGAILVAHHPEGMMPDEFWGLVKKRSSGARFPSFLSRRFGSTVAERVENSFAAGRGPSTSIGGAFAGAILASQVMAYLLQPLSGCMSLPLRLRGAAPMRALITAPLTMSKSSL